MKTRAATTTILISLAAVTGCGSGDGEYLVYDKTSPSEFEENQKHETTAQDKVPSDIEELTAATKSAEPAAISSSDAGRGSIEAKDTVSVSVQPASHQTNSGDVVPESTTEIKSIVSPQSGLTGRADTPDIDNGTTQNANKIELLIPEKTFRHERGTNAVRISYDDIDLLKVLNMEPVPVNAPEYFPDWLSSLNGKQVRIRGWMYPTFVSEGLTQFTLARDNGICCFQRMPKIYDVIFVKLADGEETDYIDQRPFDVEGTFKIDSEGDGTELPRLYKIDNARVLN